MRSVRLLTRELSAHDMVYAIRVLASCCCVGLRSYSSTSIKPPARPHVTVYASVPVTPRAVPTALFPTLIVPSHLYPLHTAYLRSFLFPVFSPSPPYKSRFLGSPSTSGFLSRQENDVIVVLPSEESRKWKAERSLIKGF